VATITNCWKILRHCLVRDVDLERLCTWVVILGAKSSDRPRLPCHDAAGRVLGLVRTTATHSIAEAARLWPGRADVGIFFERGGELALKKRSHDRFAERKYNTCVPPKVFAAAAFKLFSLHSDLGGFPGSILSDLVLPRPRGELPLVLTPSALEWQDSLAFLQTVWHHMEDCTQLT
jgi:hypothetical protein